MGRVTRPEVCLKPSAGAMNAMDVNVEITFLGTGTSVGVPMIGCGCRVCRSDDPKNHRLRSSIFVRTPEIALVVDTGPDFRQQCLRAGIEHLDAAVFTHAHSDHVMGFDDLRRFTVGEHEELPIHATAACLERLEASFPYVFDGENRYRGYLKVLPNSIDGPFVIGDLELIPLSVTHGKVETIGFLFQRGGRRLFAYIPDAKTLSEEATAALQGIEVLILDGLQPEAHWTHLSTSEAVALAGELGAGQTWLTHFSCRSDYTIIEPTLPSGIRMAWDGLVLRV